MNGAASRSAVIRISSLALGAAVVVTSTALPVSAKAGDVIERATCATGQLKLKLSPDNGRIETEVEVDTNRRGQTWSVRIFHDGTRVTKTRGVTAGRSGSFEVRRRLPNSAGADNIRASARRGDTVCQVRATF